MDFGPGEGGGILVFFFSPDSGVSEMVLRELPKDGAVGRQGKGTNGQLSLAACSSL